MENHMVLGNNGRYDYAGDNESKDQKIYKCIFCSNSTYDRIQMYRCYFYFENHVWDEIVCADCLKESEYIKVIKL